MSVRTLLAAALIAGAAVAPVATATAAPLDARYWNEVAQDDGPQEDEPGWDCATMGNRVCGELR
ncbi:hypothetical protein A5630_25475 [Mycolicibacterium mucogenicum]|uniref:Uncharacterized protein n=1 Tax=Mycolicibacterium mucogenicum TaxID=56689 RepID=A0A1A3GWV1_MYCMU|nr:hypothetical protein [Mycolicibacterium mucogenicum]OBJ40305.1 hypothetical protein A5630_25475 [Mycolicibacterium mucogenicum]